MNRCLTMIVFYVSYGFVRNIIWTSCDEAWRNEETDTFSWLCTDEWDTEMSKKEIQSSTTAKWNDKSEKPSEFSKNVLWDDADVTRSADNTINSKWQEFNSFKIYHQNWPCRAGRIDIISIPSSKLGNSRYIRFLVLARGSKAPPPSPNAI